MTQHGPKATKQKQEKLKALTKSRMGIRPKMTQGWA